MPRRARPAFEPKIAGLVASPPGTYGSRLDRASAASPYLDFFQPLEPEAALLSVRLSNRERSFSQAFGVYPSGDVVEFGQFGSLAPQEKRSPGGGNRRLATGRDGRPRSYEVAMSVPLGYGPSLLHGRLLLVSEDEERTFPMSALPKPKPTNVDALPPVTRVEGVSVALRRGMSSVHLAPSPKDDPTGYDATHRQLQYTGAYFSTTVAPGYLPGRTIDLVMRLKRTKWCDRPGQRFVLRVRDVLNPSFEPVDQYSLSVDPASKMAEFECVLVETRAWTEKAVIPSLGTLVGEQGVPQRLDLGPNRSGRTRSGWGVVVGQPDRPMIADDMHGELGLPTTVISPTTGAVQSTEGMPNPLEDAHYVCDIQLSDQRTEPNSSPGEPVAGARGYLRIGPLGDATVTVCHLERKVHPATLLRLPLRPGGKGRQPEMFMNALNEVVAKPPKH